MIEACILKIESILCGDSMSHVTHTSNIRKAYKKGTCENGIIYFILLLRKPNMMISKLWFLNSLCSARYDIAKFPDLKSNRKLEASFLGIQIVLSFKENIEL